MQTITPTVQEPKGAMKQTLRRPEAGDVEAIGEVIFAAFASIADRHNFPRDFASPENGVQLAQMAVGNPAFFGVVVEIDGRIAGSNFIDVRDQIGGIGPITVHPDYQGQGLGRVLMQAVIDEGNRRMIGEVLGKGLRGQRLVQDAFNTTSMSLYASLGFDAREPLALMMGMPREARDAKKNSSVRPMTDDDVEACAAICRDVHGISRANELRAAIQHFKPFIMQRGDRITAYCTAPNFWLLNHGVAESEDDLRALLLGAAAATEQPVAMLVPVRQASFFRWCLEQGLRMIKPMTLMSMGEYHEPRGAFFPSVQY